MIRHSVDSLAIFGGGPEYGEPLHVGRPNIGDKQAILSRLADILDRRWLTNNGPCLRELEEKIAARAGVRHCVCMCNGTVALEVLVKALGLTGEVIVPSFTFVATAHCVSWLGLKPVFADVNPSTHSLDVKHVESLINRHTSAILGVHLWGVPCAVGALGDLAKRHALRLIYDAAHAFGCSSGGTPIGGFGDAEVFSFHATKFFNTFEGGAIVTNDEALAERCRKLRNFGFQGFDDVVEIGTNGKMPEVCAAMGLESLLGLDGVVRHNRENWRTYSRLLGELPGLSVLRYDENEACNYQYVVVTVDAARTGLTRDELVQVLHAENVLARRYFTPGTHRMRAYAEAYADVRLPVTEQLAECVLCLPTGTAVDPNDVAKICNVMRLALSDPERVRAALRQLR